MAGLEDAAAALAGADIAPQHLVAFRQGTAVRGAEPQAIEQTLVAGTRIVVADEWLTTQNTQTPIGRRLRETYPSMTIDPEPPIDLLPEGVLEKHMSVIFKGFGYCVTWRKP